jgi:hypothetical protein
MHTREGNNSSRRDPAKATTDVTILQFAKKLTFLHPIYLFGKKWKIKLRTHHIAASFLRPWRLLDPSSPTPWLVCALQAHPRITYQAKI